MREIRNDTTYGLRVSHDLLASIRERAERDGKPVAVFVREAIETALEPPPEPEVVVPEPEPSAPPAPAPKMQSRCPHPSTRRVGSRCAVCNTDVGSAL